MEGQTKHTYKNYEDYYRDNFRVEHAHPINRLLHFIGITMTYLCFFYGIITLHILYIIFCIVPFATLSLIGHKLI